MEDDRFVAGHGESVGAGGAGTGAPLTGGRLLAGRYEVLELLGAGGEARVVKALDHQHGRTVALKIRRVVGEHAREELLGEARLLLGLEPHPALPIVREDFFLDDEYVVAMDWVDGTDLGRILAENGTPGLAPSSVVAYLAEVAEALMFLHAQDPPIVHGDVKPANLILTRGGHVKLVDFGLSSTPLMLDRRSGTPGYRAPELATGSAPSPASDVYGLAATAFALLTGSPPAGVLPEWEGIDPALAAQLEAVVRLGLATDPARRPPTPGEFVERLRAGWGATLPTGVTTFCLSDIVSSTALWERDPVAMAAALVRHDELIASAVESHGGRFLKSKGEADGTFSVFESASDAVAAAIAATQALEREPWPNDWEITVRFGIHTGEAERRDADYFGPTVNLATRVRAQAGAREILLSQRAADLSVLPAGYSLVDLVHTSSTASKSSRRCRRSPVPAWRRRCPRASVPIAGCCRSMRATASSSSGVRTWSTRCSTGSSRGACWRSSGRRAAASPRSCVPA